MRKITQETADGLLNAWADQAREVNLLSFQGEVAAFATQWVGTVKAVRAGIFQHTSGQTENVVVTSQFSEIFLGEDDEFIALRLQEPFGISPSRFQVILGIRKLESFTGRSTAFSELVH